MNARNLFGTNMCAGKAGLAAGTTTTLTIGTTVAFSIGGRAYSKTNASNIATPTTDALTGAAFVPVQPNQGSVFVVALDSGGNLKIAQGSVVALDGAAGGSTALFSNTPPQFPTLPDTLTAIGYIVTKVGASGSTWTFGSSNLAGPPSNVLHTYVDCFVLPDRPQIN
jgi:hypothetical protein